jgi:hypothetical protein
MLSPDMPPPTGPKTPESIPSYLGVPDDKLAQEVEGKKALPTVKDTLEENITDRGGVSKRDLDSATGGLNAAFPKLPDADTATGSPAAEEPTETGGTGGPTGTTPMTTTESADAAEALRAADKLKQDMLAFFKPSAKTALMIAALRNAKAQLEIQEMTSKATFGTQNARADMSLAQKAATIAGGAAAAAQSYVQAAGALAGAASSAISLGRMAKSEGAAEANVTKKIGERQKEIDDLKLANKDVPLSGPNQRQISPQKLQDEITAAEGKLAQAKADLAKYQAPRPPAAAAAADHGAGVGPGPGAVGVRAGADAGAGAGGIRQNEAGYRREITKAEGELNQLKELQKQKTDRETVIKEKESSLQQMKNNKEDYISRESQALHQEYEKTDAAIQGVTRAITSILEGQFKMQEANAQADGIMARATAEMYTENIRNTEQLEQAAIKSSGDGWEIVKQFSRSLSSWGHIQG